jgi:molybdenum cofactor synthesis domain-containing protein
VFVTDVRETHLVLDVLVPSVSLEQVAGQQQALLQALAAVPGVRVAADASVHSNGVLGVIGAEPEQAKAIIVETERVAQNIHAYAARRVAVVSTGAELLDGRVKDTNWAAVQEFLGAAGYEVVSGGVVGDERQAIAGRVSRLGSEGFGLIITTGGVGAESKDCTVEALELLHPGLATAVLASYKPGHGRHVKPSVRIAVARFGWTLAVALPGPTHEVRLALPILLQGLQQGLSDAELVEAMARPLRATLPVGHAHRHAGNHHV